MAQTTPPLIQLHQITRRFPGVVALDHVSFSVNAGEIHAVVGENGAGKSTLMNILAGEVQPDSGTILLEGRAQTIPSPLAAQKFGISVVYQELALCMNLSIAENIALNSVANYSPLRLLRRRQFDDHAREVLAQLGLQKINPHQIVGRLSVAQQQLVEIAKAISMKARVLLLDEPNSALTIEETGHLFEVLRQLRQDGVAIMYVSHRLEEVLQIADEITILRDGRHISTTRNDGSVTIENMITQMVGRSIDHFFKRADAQKTDSRHGVSTAALRVEDFASDEAVRSVTFTLQQGEVLGIAGLPDSGKDELVNALFGLRRATGRVHVNGVEAQIKTPSVAIKHGLSLIPADRRGSGALLLMSVENNTVAASLGQVSQLGLLNGARIHEVGSNYVRQLDTRIASLKQKMRTLSGGNQQKVIIGRSLATQPAVLLLHEPTRGIDVGAKAEIYQILQRLAAQGVAVLIVSSELPELISQCDRILVMYRGKVTGEFAHADATEQAILACAMGQAEHLAGAEITKEKASS